MTKEEFEELQVGDVVLLRSNEEITESYANDPGLVDYGSPSFFDEFVFPYRENFTFKVLGKNNPTMSLRVSIEDEYGKGFTAYEFWNFSYLYFDVPQKEDNLEEVRGDFEALFGGVLNG